MSEWRIRWAIPMDLPDLTDLEAESCERPLSGGDLNCLLTRRRDVSLLVAEGCGGEVAGYAAYQLNRGRIELLRLAVRPGWRRLGVARTLLEVAASKLARHRRSALCCWVPERLLSAQLTLKACGFLGLPAGEGSIRFVRFAEELAAV